MLIFPNCIIRAIFLYIKKKKNGAQYPRPVVMTTVLGLPLCMTLNRIHYVQGDKTSFLV